MLTNPKNLLIAAACSTLIACSGSSSNSNTNAASDTNAYNGPGSKWDVELSEDNSFTITRRDTPQTPVDLTVTGSYTRHDSGFVGLTVGSAEGTNAPSAGDEAWALEVPGYALLLKPMGDDKIIAMVSAGECPTSDIDANWVVVKQHSTANATDANQDYFGTFNYVVDTGTPSLPSKHSISTGFPTVTGGGGLGSGSCSDGLMFVGTEPDIAAMYLTSTGGAIVQTNINDENDAQFIFALAQKEISDIGALEGDYAGMLFDDNMADGSSVNPVALSCDNAGTCTGKLVTDIETGAVDTDTVTVTLNGLPDTLGDGFVTGMISDGGSTPGNLSCMIDVGANRTSKNIVNCVGQSPGDNTKMFNVMFVSK